MIYWVECTSPSNRCNGCCIVDWCMKPSKRERQQKMKETNSNEVLNANASDTNENNSTACAVNESTDVETMIVYVVEAVNAQDESDVYYQFISDNKDDIDTIASSLLRQYIANIDEQRRKNNRTDFRLKYDNRNHFTIEDSNGPMGFLRAYCDRKCPVTPKVIEGIACGKKTAKKAESLNPDCLKHVDSHALLKFMQTCGGAIVSTDHGIACVKDGKHIFFPM